MTLANVESLVVARKILVGDTKPVSPASAADGKLPTPHPLPTSTIGISSSSIDNVTRPPHQINKNKDVPFEPYGACIALVQANAEVQQKPWPQPQPQPDERALT